MGSASCGTRGPAELPAAQAPQVAEASVERGIVIGLRPLGAPPVAEYQARAVAQVLRVATGPGAPPPAAAVEVIVRLEGGVRDIVFIRGASENLRLGQRVTLTTGDHPDLLP
ncbi:MAG: hypothetical protein JWR10_4759 [Rubritepida sp.]|nr:hypothetical protein [Rubritepida sp.]